MWRRLVKLWVSVEAKHGFDEHGVRLPARGCPPVVAEWIKRVRSPKYRPTIGNLTTFENTYTSWWRSIQLSWRVSDDSALLNKGEGDWEDIKCMGVNGLLSVLAALFFWGVALEGNNTTVAAWKAAVDDATYVLETM